MTRRIQNHLNKSQSLLRITPVITTVCTLSVHVMKRTSSLKSRIHSTRTRLKNLRFQGVLIQIQMGTAKMEKTRLMNLGKQFRKNLGRRKSRRRTRKMTLMRKWLLPMNQNRKQTVQILKLKKGLIQNQPFSRHLK